MQVFCVIEKTGDEYLAYCDELRATASGDTEQEALNNLKAAIAELLKHYGEEITGPGKKRVLVEVV
ncbi:type II toxin-antitoxin system HicB family antitoxin [Neomoorella carbonis]|uniref:type II toxin-antitoxin system HicB family antitoxin n=1 Tax=Neomoorella carbonis TaxID=3062783 RepID=UPI00324E2ED8